VAKKGGDHLRIQRAQTFERRYSGCFPFCDHSFTDVIAPLQRLLQAIVQLVAGYQWRVVLITNFHLPALALVVSADGSAYGCWRYIKRRFWLISLFILPDVRC